MSTKKSWKLKLFIPLALIAGVVMSVARVCADAPAQALPAIVSYGSIVTIGFKGEDDKTPFYYLKAVPDVTYSYDKCETGVMAVSGSKSSNKPECQWIVKGMYPSLNQRARFEGVRIGYPVQLNYWMTLENVASGYTLRLNAGNRSIYSSLAGDKGNSLGSAAIKTSSGACSDQFDYVIFYPTDNTSKVINNNTSSGLAGNFLFDGSPVRIYNPNGWYLQCDTKEKIDGRQQIDLFGGYDPKTCDAIVQLVAQPYADNNLKEVRDTFAAQRGGKLTYRTPIYFDNLANCSWSRFWRMWTLASSWVVGDDPDDNVSNPWELLIGMMPLLAPNDCNDFNLRSPASCMMIVNAKDPKATGAVKWGDQVRIYSLFAARNANPKRMSKVKEKVELPFRVWVLGSSFLGGDSLSIQVCHPDNKAAKDAQSVWMFEPAAAGIAGEICLGDAFMMRNQGQAKALLSMYPSNRLGYSNQWGSAYSPWAATSQPNNAPWGSPFWMCSPVDANWFNASDESKASWAALAKSFADVMGGDASLLGSVSGLSDDAAAKKAADDAAAKAAAAKAAEDQLKADQAKKDAELKAAQDAAAAKQAAADAAAKKAADDAAKQAAADAAAKAAADADAKAKALAASREQDRLDAIKAAELLKAEKQKALDALKKAQDAMDAEKQAILDAKKVAEFEANQQKQKMEAFAARMLEIAELPAGFEKVAGSGFGQVAVGSKNIAKASGDSKSKSTSIQSTSTGIALLNDGSLLEFIGAHVDNPWRILDAPDGKVKHIAAGEGRYAVVMDDGRVFVANDPDHVAQLPKPGKAVASVVADAGDAEVKPDVAGAAGAEVAAHEVVAKHHKVTREHKKGLQKGPHAGAKKQHHNQHKQHKNKKSHSKEHANENAAEPASVEAAA